MLQKNNNKFIKSKSWVSSVQYIIIKGMLNTDCLFNQGNFILRYCLIKKTFKSNNIYMQLYELKSHAKIEIYFWVQQS